MGVKKIVTALRALTGGHGYHVFFAFSLATMIALAVWWSVFIMTAIDESYAGERLKLRYQAHVHATALGRGDLRPAFGALPREPALEVYSAEEAAYPAIPLSPNWEDRRLGISRQRLLEIEDKYRRQKIMVFGEGSLLLLLLLVSVFALYRLVAVERRSRKDMDRFIDLVTHELKTPMAGIRMLLQSLSMGRVQKDALPRLIDLGLRNLDRQEHLVENILLRNRLRSRDHPTRLDVFSLRRQVETIIRHRQESRPKVSPPIVEEGGETKVLADADSLRVILENLLDNSEKYGGAKPVRIAITAEDQHAVLTVTDEGAGIKARHLERIFRPYYRAGLKVKGLRHGSGLGLAISRDLAVRMGATLRAYSEGAGKGARFVLRLKKAESAGDSL